MIDNRPKIFPSSVQSPRSLHDVRVDGDDAFELNDERVRRIKPGPRRREQRDKITVAGSKRILDRFKSYCQKTDEPSYCAAIERLLEIARRSAEQTLGTHQRSRPS